MSILIDELADLIGYQPAIELVRAWGGRRLHVPERIEPDHPIALTIGEEAAEKLRTYYAQSTLELPAQRNALIAMRNRAIVLARQAGRPTREIAREYGVTPRHVRYIVAKAEESTQAETSPPAT